VNSDNKFGYDLRTTDAPIRPLIPHLIFIRDKNRWGSVFRFGILQIDSVDFISIAQAMQLACAILERPQDS